MQEGELLYRAYQKAMEERGIGIDDWEDLTTEDQEAYQQAAEQLLEWGNTGVEPVL